MLWRMLRYISQFTTLLTKPTSWLSGLKCLSTWKLKSPRIALISKNSEYVLTPWKQEGRAQRMHFLSISQGLFVGITVNMRSHFSLWPCLDSMCFSGDPRYAMNCHLFIILVPCFSIGENWKLVWETTAADLWLGESISVGVPEKWMWNGL